MQLGQEKDIGLLLKPVIPTASNMGLSTTLLSSTLRPHGQNKKISGVIDHEILARIFS